MTFLNSAILHAKLIIIFILTILFIFLSDSGGVCGEAEDEYYNILVSSYKNFNDAAALSDSLKTQGYDSFCETVNIPKKGEWRRVFIGRYKDRDEALKTGRKLIEKGIIKNFIVLKSNPENKKAALGRNTKNEKKVLLPPVLTKTKANLLNTEKIVLPHKAYKDKADPDLKADSELKAGMNLYDGAMSDFTSGRYKNALIKFKEIFEAKKNETAMRRIADCHYFLGQKGDKQHVSEA
ncbi:MAG: SPOR domain-containing protein, partial [Desulfobacterales bacterium]|nr:SPOR domain-containing protein [Desulfobacterales bacterium]